MVKKITSLNKIDKQKDENLAKKKSLNVDEHYYISGEKFLQLLCVYFFTFVLM